MSRSDWTDLWERFHAALALPPSQRDAWLDEHCTDPALRAELAALLEAAGRTGTPLDREGVAAAEPLAPGTRMGPWRIVAPLGRGGMGEVYRVERADGRYDKQAALKLLATTLQGDAFRARFDRERRILAGLDHPGIARLIDAGQADDGRPWLLMDLVEGQPITRAAAESAWPLERRLRVFAQACDAVAYAHRRLIVHRDLKPANLLVDPSGRPRLLDFGIARLLEAGGDDDLTQAGRGAPNTPGYASPEQLVRDDTGTAVDVYALGLLLHELCTGQAPFGPDGEADALERRRRPPRPTAVDPDLPRELDWIVGRACAFRAEDRYPGVDALIDDIRAVLENRPPRARATGPVYRIGKFVRRNRAAVAATTLVAGVIVTLATGIVQETARTRAALAESDRQREQAELTAQFLRDLFVQSDSTRNEGAEPTAGELLARGRQRLAERGDLDPRLHAGLLRTLSDVHRNLGDYPAALELAKESLARLEPTDRMVHAVDRARGWLRVGRAQLASGDPAAAHEALGRGLELLSADGPSPLVVDLLHARGASAQLRGELDEAGLDFDAAMARLDRLPSPDPRRAAENRLRRGSWHWMNGRLGDALAAYGEAVRWQRERSDGSSADLATALDAEASALFALGRMEEAEAAFAQVVRLRRRVLGADHPLTARSLSHLGGARFELGRIEDARSTLGEALAILERIDMGDSPQAAGVLNNLGLAERAAGRTVEARSAFEGALAINRGTLGPDHLNVANNLNNLGLVAEDEQAWEQALEYYDDAERIIRAIKGDGHPDRAFQQTNRGRVLLVLDRIEAARVELDAALELRTGALGPEHPRVAETLFWSGLAECLRGAAEEGSNRLQRAIEVSPAAEPRVRSALEACRGRADTGPAVLQSGAERRLVQRLLDSTAR
ncbi:serine/threonine-protein kinase [Halomonas denitrificans]|nr:serine/threonine-protein kinase [Halomonas denitrificans]